MDISYLSNLSQDQHRKANNGFGRKKQFLPPSKPQPSAQVASSAVQLFLARKQHEERQKYEEFQKKKEELLSLRSQNSKNNKKAKLMASRTRDNDFSRIKLTEDEEEAKANREKELRKKGLHSKVDRMKARIELEERDNQLPHKRKRKSHLFSNDEPLNNVNNINMDVKIEHKVNGSGISLPVSVHQKNETERKISKYKPKPAPIIDYKNLLQVAAKKQYEPIVPPFEDFDEESDEYEEENEIHAISDEKFTIKHPEYHDSLKEDRTIPKQHTTLNKNRTVEKARLNSKFSDIHESRQNKENAYKNHNHNAYNQLHKVSGEHGRNIHNNNQSNTSLSQNHSMKNVSDCVALHSKENQTTYNREIHASKNISHSNSSKYHYDSKSRDNIADRRNTNISKEDNNIHMANAVTREHPEKLQVQTQDRTKYQKQPTHTKSSSFEKNNYSDSLALNRKHEQTFRSSNKIVTDRKNYTQHAVAPVARHSTDYSRNEQKVTTSMAKHCLKKDNETISDLKNNHSNFKECRKTESSPSFRIPKKDSNKMKTHEYDTPCYYTDNGSNSFKDVNQSNPDKRTFVKASSNPVLKSNKNSSVEKSQEYPSYNDSSKKIVDKTNKSHAKFNSMHEQIIKNRNINDTSNHQQRTESKHTIQHSNGKLKEKFSHSKPPEKSSSNRSGKVSNSNEYFTEEGQAKVQHNVAVEYNPTKDRIKNRNEPPLSSEVCQYFTEQFTTGESKYKERSDDLKRHSQKKNYNSSEQEKSRVKHDHHFTEHFVNSHSSQATCDMKQHKHEKSKLKQPQYFTEQFVADGNNTTKTIVPNCKYDKRTAVPQKEKQNKQSQYFTEYFATDGNNTVINNEPNYRYDKKNTAHQKEKQMKQSQYFTENFVTDGNNTLKRSEHNCKYDKRTTLPQKEKQIKQSQYFTENSVTAENKMIKSNDPSCKYDKRTAVSQKERQMKEPQYFTEHFATDVSNTTKISDSNCKYDKRASVPQKQMKQTQYFTEHFITNESKAKNSDSNCNYNKRTNLSQKEKQPNHTQYFTEQFATDVNNKTKRIDLNSKHEKRTIVPQKEKQAKQSQYFTESFTNDRNYFEKDSSDLNYKHERNTIVPQTEKSKIKPSQNTYKIQENISKKTSSKSILSHSSNSHYEMHNKMQKNDHAHSYKSEDVRRFPKRPREESETTESLPSKVCKYENPITNKVQHIGNYSKKDKSLVNQSKERSKTLNHSKIESKFEENKEITDVIGSKEKISDASRRHVHSSKVLNSKYINPEQENKISNSHSNTKLKEHCEKLPTSEQILFKKPLHEKIIDKEKLLHQNGNSSLLKHALPAKAKKIIPASSMAQLMYKKSLQNVPLQKTASAKTQSQNFESSKSKKLLQSSADAKRTANQIKSDNPPSSVRKPDTGKNCIPKQAHADAKYAVNHQKVNSPSQRNEKEGHFDHRKSHFDNTHRNLVKKPVLNQGRKMKQDQYDSKNRNRFTRPSPKMFIKRNMDSDEEEDDDEEDDDDMSDFIDDGPIEEDEEDYSHYIREIFGYDKRRYRFEDEDDDRDMETSYAQQMKEERRSARIGLLEDLEDMRKEEEEKKSKTKKQKL